MRLTNAVANSACEFLIRPLHNIYKNTGMTLLLCNAGSKSLRLLVRGIKKINSLSVRGKLIGSLWPSTLYIIDLIIVLLRALAMNARTLYNPAELE